MGTADGSPYIVSELLEGQNLREVLRQGPVPARKVLDYAIQAARGLAAAHDIGIVHRDLKPENLFITKFDGTLKQGLTADFEQSPFSNVVSDNQVNETLRLMGHSGNERVTEVIAREICVRRGSKALLAGSIAKLGLVALDLALTRLAELDAEQSRLVELRYFAGLTIEETAQVMGTSAATVKRSWTICRAWLRREISAPGA